MEMRKLVAAAGCAAMTLAAPANAQETPLVFDGAGDWTADFGEDYCRLLRTFSNGDDSITLAFERIQPGPNMRILAIGDAFRTFRGADRIGYDFAPRDAEPPFPPSTDFATSATGDGSRLTILSFVSMQQLPVFNQAFQPRDGDGSEELPQFPGYDPASEVEDARSIHTLAFDDGMARPLHFELGPMGDVMQVLQQCTSSLVASWGLDPDRHATMQRGAFPAQGALIGRSTVPFDQFARLAGNYNQVRVMVDASGEATGCHIHFPTLEANVNERICEEVIENADFSPAIDAEGNAMDSYWLAPVFVLFGPPPG